MINVYKNIISDEQFNLLMELDAFNKTKIRNRLIKKQYAILNKSFSPEKAFDILNKKYNYITRETIKKIIYKKD